MYDCARRSMAKKSNRLTNEMFLSFQCGEGEDSSGGRQGLSGGCVQPQHALQMERSTHPDLTSVSEPVGENFQ